MSYQHDAHCNISQSVIYGLFCHMLIKRHYRFRLAHYYLSISIFCKLLWTGVFPFSFIPHRCISSYFLSELNRSNCFWQKMWAVSILHAELHVHEIFFSFEIANGYSYQFQIAVLICIEIHHFKPTKNKLKYILLSVFFII